MATIPTITIPGMAPAAAPTPEAQPTRPPKVAKPADKRGWWWGTGRRKTAVARVRMKPSSNPTFVVIGATGKKKTIDEYFSEVRDRNDCVAAFKAANMEGKFEVVAQCHGGGKMGQSQAIRLGIARALRDYDPACEGALRQAGFLTRDSREVERKKYGQAGARRRFQFSKR
ncbi:MAG: 30S ribosomal protein S9 [Phycisphaerae bacterium]|nr:MAG: 30S ribosomal protein S9 [Phycisphaerae bacterium]